MLGRGLGENLTNLYPDGKLLGESLAHMLDYFSANGLIRASECFQYYPIINTLKTASSEEEKMMEKTAEGLMKPALHYQTEKGAHHQLQEKNSEELVNLTPHYQTEKGAHHQL